MGIPIQFANAFFLQGSWAVHPHAVRMLAVVPRHVKGGGQQEDTAKVNSRRTTALCQEAADGRKAENEREKRADNLGDLQLFLQGHRSGEASQD